MIEPKKIARAFLGTDGRHSLASEARRLIEAGANHIEISGSITKAVTAVRGRKKKVFIEVEVKTFDELVEALSLKVDRVMLDNMNIAQIKQAVEIVHQKARRVEIEVSGGVDMCNVEDLLDCGVDFVSAGALTHSAPAIDIAMKLKLIGSCES